MDYNPGSGTKTYAMTCTASVCECKVDTTFVNDGSGSGACASVESMRTAYRSLCCPH